MNTCLLSMLLLTIGSAFLAALATHFKRQMEVDALNNRIKKMKTTLEKLDVEHRNSIAYYEGMREEITNYATERNTVEQEIAELEGQIAELETENNALRNPGSVAASTNADQPKLLPTPDNDNGDGVEFAQTNTNKRKRHKRKKLKSKNTKSKAVNREVENLSEQNEALEKEVTELKAYKSKVEELEAKMESITRKMDVNAAASPTVVPTPAPPVISKTPKPTPPKKIRRNINNNNKITKVGSTKVAKQDNSSILKRINRRRKEVDFEKIGFSAMGRKDDLQKINGIEPFIEKKLNALGIYRFSQLANFDEEIAKKVSNLIEMENADKDLLLWSDRAKTLTE